MNTSHLPVFVPLPKGTIITPPQTLADIIARISRDIIELQPDEPVEPGAEPAEPVVREGAALRQRIMAAVPDRETNDKRITATLEKWLHEFGELQAAGISPDDFPDGLWDIKHALKGILADHREVAALFIKERDHPRP